MDVRGENGARMANCEVLGNSTQGAGGGIRIEDLDTKVTLVDCVVGENSAEVGGGRPPASTATPKRPVCYGR